MNSREAAYLAAYHFFKQGSFAVDFLSQWQWAENPLPRDFHLAQEIAYGTIRMAITLDYLAKRGTAHQKLPGKLKEKALLRTALYQFYFMDKVPLYAIANETIKIARKICHKHFTAYLNAFLRKLENMSLSLPLDDSIDSLSTRLSYPPPFVESLIKDYGLPQAKNILEAGNQTPMVMARGRSIPFSIKKIESQHLSAVAQDPNFYIQNITPTHFISELCSRKFVPQRILDLCSSPGGKLIGVHDHFPHAQLHANDISEEKLKRLRNNLEKYQINAHLSCMQGEKYSCDEKFDLIILDVPCSNSGVLHKRPEARWRQSEVALAELEATQMALLENARHLLHPQGEIWYMTCSVLKAENEHLTQKASTAFGLKPLFEKTILPQNREWDGGYACALSFMSR